MRKMVPILVAVLVAAVSWIFFTNFRIVGLHRIEVVPKSAAGDSSTFGSFSKKLTDFVGSSPDDGSVSNSPTATDVNQLPRIRIATFNVQAFDQSKVRKPAVLDILARIGREFDVLALQEIRSEADDILPRLVALMNKTGRSFDYAVGPRVGPLGSEEQYGFVFNRQTVLLDRQELYTVNDRDDVLSFEPFVAWFRAVGPPANEAFTFSVVNLRVDPATAEQELGYVDDVLFAVRDDGRQEDDILLAGDLQAAPGKLQDLDLIRDVGYAVTNVPTNVEGTATWDNLLFQKTATSEFTGNSGVLDFLRKFNLDLATALEVSDHLPVWAEFHLYEGGQPGRVAQDNPAPRR